MVDVGQRSASSVDLLSIRENSKKKVCLHLCVCVFLDVSFVALLVVVHLEDNEREWTI